MEVDGEVAQPVRYGRPGPSDFAGIIEWPERVIQDVPRLGARCKEVLQRKKVLMTTHYSGVGCAELALAQLEGVGEFDSTTYSASEIDVKTRSLLLASKFSPDHVFGDVLEMLPTADQSHLLLVQKDALDAARDLDEHPERLTVEEIEDSKARVGVQMMAKMVKVLEKTKFRKRAHCYVHGRACSLQPRLRPDELHIEAAGTTCLAWSSMRSPDSATKQWLHESTLPCLVWMFWVKHVKPHLLIHECVSQYQWGYLADTLSQYFVLSINFSPKLLGVPANRWRRYTIGALVEKLSIVENSTMPALALKELIGDEDEVARVRQLLVALFQSAFFRDLIANCNVYQQATVVQKNQFMRNAMNHLGLVYRAEADFAHILPAANFQRAMGYRNQFKTMLEQGHAMIGDVAAVDLGQTVGRNGVQPSGVVPALLTRSEMAFMTAEPRLDRIGTRIQIRSVLPLEHFAIQSFPISMPHLPHGIDGVVDERVREMHHMYFPWQSDDIFTAPDTLLKKVMGNGMHLEAVGTVQAFALALFEFSPAKQVPVRKRGNGGDPPPPPMKGPAKKAKISRTTTPTRRRPASSTPTAPMKRAKRARA